jgi:hypothetical protein
VTVPVAREKLTSIARARQWSGTSAASETTIQERPDRAQGEPERTQTT